VNRKPGPSLRLAWLVVLVSTLSFNSGAAHGSDLGVPNDRLRTSVEQHLRSSLEAEPANEARARALADFLSYQPGRLTEAIELYHTLLAGNSGDLASRHGLARSLAWLGQSAEATEHFEKILHSRPDDAEAHFGRGQLARWSGDRTRARMHLRRAIELAPGIAHYHEEYGRLELQAGWRSLARKAVAHARQLGGDVEDLESAISAAHSPSARLKSSFSDETNDFRRSHVNARVEFSGWLDSRILLEPGFTRFEDDSGDLDRVSIRLSVSKPLPRDLRLDARYALRKPVDEDETHEVGAELGGRPFSLPVEFRIGGSRHSMVDRRPGFEDIEPLEGMGSGGNSLQSILDQRQLTEAYVGLSSSPLRATYTYIEYSAGWINDGNRRNNLTAGLGVDLVRILNGPGSHILNLQFDLFYLDYDRDDPDYFSPSNFLVQTPGLSWRWRVRELIVLGLEAGVPWEFGERAGWLAGGFAQIELRPQVFLGARLRHMKNASYRISSGTIGLRFAL
jgi:tetratricopeptide (TPR) repeat protein